MNFEQNYSKLKNSFLNLSLGDKCNRKDHVDFWRILSPKCLYVKYNIILSTLWLNKYLN